MTAPTFPQELPGTLWGIVPYFNFAGYRSKVENYRIFRESLRAQGLPLIAVEGALPGVPFELTPDDADILIQRRTNSVLWQKERLINVAREHLPDDCDKIVWLDGDVVFEHRQWIDDTCRLLTEYNVVQPFSEIQRLAPGVLPPAPGDPPPATEQVYQSAVWQTLMPQGKERKILGAPGLALAARRLVIDDCGGLYDRMILGGGDTLVLGSFMGLSVEHLDYIPYFPPGLLPDARGWAMRASAVVGGSVWYAPGTGYHLWHGTRETRYYVERQLLLHDFDPKHDICIGSGGCWEWTSNKPDLQDAVRRYFSIRSEDGIAPSHEEEALFDLQVRLAAARVCIQELKGRLLHWFFPRRMPAGGSLRWEYLLQPPGQIADAVDHHVPPPVQLPVADDGGCRDSGARMTTRRSFQSV